MTMNADWIHRFDQATGTFRHIAEILAAFRRSLIEEGFTEADAGDLVEVLLDFYLREAGSADAA